MMDFYSEPVCYLLSKEIENYHLSEMKNIPIIIPKNDFHNDYIKTAHMKILTACPTAQVIIVDDIGNYLFLIGSGDAVGLMSKSMVLYYKNRNCLIWDFNYTIDHSFPELKTYIYCLKESEESIKLVLDSMSSDKENYSAESEK